MHVTATELRLRLGYYLEQVSEEDIWISKNGKTIAKLINPNVSAVDSISGILKDRIRDSADARDLRDERISKYKSHD